LPIYNVLAISGEAHAQSFTVECNISGILRTIAVGASRRKAEQEAARRALELIT
jgi:ribonuclease-3